VLALALDLAGHDGREEAHGALAAAGGHVHLEHGAAQLRLQRRRRVVRDHAALVDDGDTLREDVGLLQVLAW
jgi:hypothetical protein